MLARAAAGGPALAALAAALFLAAPATTVAADQATGHCMGVNACKGRSSCRSARNSCEGHNACKGQGFVELTRQQCDQVGGSFEPAAHEPAPDAPAARGA
jgi:hypothetical protein